MKDKNTMPATAQSTVQVSVGVSPSRSNLAFDQRPGDLFGGDLLRQLHAQLNSLDEATNRLNFMLGEVGGLVKQSVKK
mgnify:CR=1 FL=1